MQESWLLVTASWVKGMSAWNGMFDQVGTVEGRKKDECASGSVAERSDVLSKRTTHHRKEVKNKEKRSKNTLRYPKGSKPGVDLVLVSTGSVAPNETGT